MMKKIVAAAMLIAGVLVLSGSAQALVCSCGHVTDSEGNVISCKPCPPKPKDPNLGEKPTPPDAINDGDRN